MIASLDGSFRYTSANRAYLDAVGTANPDDIICRTVEDVLGSAWWSHIKGHLDAAMRGQPVRFETQVEISAQQRYVQAIYVPQIDQNGKPAGVIALILDVHEQRVAREALRSSEANLRATLNSIREAVVATDECGRIAHMNPTAEAMTGTPFGLAAQRQLEDVVDIRDKKSRRRIGNLASWKTLNEPEAGLGSLLVSRHGDEYEVFLTVSPIFSAAMESLGTVVVMRDITSENVLRKQLSQHERLTSLGQLAGGIAHDFNNLLASMRGGAEVLDVTQQQRLSDEGTALVKAIITTCDRAADLTERLTRLGRQTNRDFAVVSLRQVVDEVVEIVGRTIGRGITIDVQFDARDTHVLGDLSSLENAVLNLCINGTQAMPKGGTLTIATRNIELTPEDCQKSMFQLSPGLHIETSIIDTGVGISEKIIDKIFDPFFTTKDVGEGSGIGLAMAYSVVTDHSGALDVSSELHKGATFRMLLPCTFPVALPAVEDAARSIAIDAMKAAGNTILLVEDELILREVLEAMLQTLGHKVITARDGAEAIEIYARRNDQIDLVLLDLNMPKIGGKEAIAELRKVNPNCKAIFMTGFADPNLFDTEHMKDAIVLKKPFSQDDLSRALLQSTQKFLVRDP